ncbi:MAG: hypothetical protein Q4B23_06235 [Helcococcus sp.]|nr:hypothetical protein [Helcococcus sp.]
MFKKILIKLYKRDPVNKYYSRIALAIFIAIVGLITDHLALAAFLILFCPGAIYLMSLIFIKDTVMEVDNLTERKYKMYLYLTIFLLTIYTIINIRYYLNMDSL